MSESTQLTVAEAMGAPVDLMPTEPQQLLAIDPQRYCDLVFESFSEKLARYKAEADAIPTPDVSTAAGMKTAIEWRARFRDEIRIATENARKERKAPILEIGRLLDSRAKDLIKEAAPYEARFDDTIKVHEAKVAARKKALEEAERARVQEIERRLVRLESLPEVYAAASPERLAEIATQLEAGLSFDYQERAADAEQLRQAVLITLRRMHVERLEQQEREASEKAAREAEESRKAAERAEAERIAAEARAAEEARLAEVRRRLDEEQAEQRRQAAENARKAQIRQWIVALNGPTHLTATDSPALIDQELHALEYAQIDCERYGEFAEEAKTVRAAGVSRLTALLDAAHAHRAEQDRITTERAELERQQQEQAARQAEIDRRDREQRETAERQAREAAEAEARRLAAEQAERERQEAEAARQREADERRQRARETPPPPMDIVKTVAVGYDVDLDIAMEWLTTLDFSKVDMEKAA